MTFNPSEARDNHGKWTAGSGSYEDLTVNSILNGPQRGKLRSRSNEEIAKELNDRGQAALKALGVESGVIDSPSGKNAVSDPKEDNIVSSAIASEIENELTRGGSEHADDWYTTKMNDAMGIAQKLHPEMANNPAARFAYTAAMAITSQGETVPRNTRLADGAYETFAKTGKFPTDVESKAQGMMNGNFEKLNKLIGEVGVAGTQKFLDKQFAVGELEKMGYVVGGSEKKTTMVYGSAILGPKIGQGFYQNLNGNYAPLTTDMWFMRGWGRLTGTLVGTVDVEKPKARFTDALKAAGEKIPADGKNLINRASEIFKAHERDFKVNRADYDSGAKKKSELVFAADRFSQANSGLKDQPSSGSQRQHIRDVFAQAQAKLADAGHKMSIADMQATWWYPEKRLYSKMGGRADKDMTVDYSTALRDLAEKKGIKL
jgi:hypothetical protein